MTLAVITSHHFIINSVFSFSEKCFNIDLQYWVVFISKVTKQINPGRWVDTERLLSYPIWNQSRNRKIISLLCRDNTCCHSLVTITLLLPAARAPRMKKSWDHYSTLLFKKQSAVGICQPSLHRNMLLDWWLAGSMSKGINVGKDLGLFLSVRRYHAPCLLEVVRVSESPLLLCSVSHTDPTYASKTAKIVVMTYISRPHAFSSSSIHVSFPPEQVPLILFSTASCMSWGSASLLHLHLSIIFQSLFF